MIKHKPLTTAARCAGLLLLPGILLAAGCGKKPDAAPGGAKGPAGAPPGAAQAASMGAVVTVEPVKRGPISKTVDVTGSLVALQDVVVGTKLAGRLAAVYLHEGDPVSAGQTVAVMDSTDTQAQLQSAQANLQAAITREQQARATLMQARSGLTQAKNALANARTTLQWTEKTTANAVSTARSGVDTAKERLSVVKQGAREQERRQAEEQVRSAKANYEKARSDLKRYQALFREQAISQSQLDEKEAVAEATQAAYNSAQQALSLVREGARPEDIRQAEIAVQTAQVALDRAQADRDQVVMRRQDVENMKAGIATAEANVKSAEAGIRSAQAGVSQAQAAVRIAQDALSNTYVKSPISGYVAERRAEPGQQLGGGGAVMRVVNPSSVYFQAVLSESQFSQVRLGQTASVTVDALPGVKLTGRVTRVLPVASSARSFNIRIDIPSDRRMRPQMFARGSVLIDTHQDATLVPKDAVIFDPANNRTRIFVAQGGTKAVERSVRTGYSNPEFVEIISGVNSGEKVITAGQTTLQNGDAIRVQTSG
jgi:RND family efflux transporter MFP subunit